MNTIRRSIYKLSCAALLAFVALPAIAQVQPQNLTITFDVSVPAAPLSDWLTAGIALLLAGMALVAIRRQATRGARFFAAFIAIAAAATFLGVTGNRLISDADAGPGPSINLVTSPAVLDVSIYVPTSPLTVPVNNMTGKFARITGITGITLANGFYAIGAPTTCTVGLTLGPGNSCTITLVSNN